MTPFPRLQGCTALLCALSLNAVADEALVLPDVLVSDRPIPVDGVLLDTPSQTGSRLGLTPRETPASISIVNRQQIEQRGARTTQDMLAGVPGLNAASPPGSAGSVSYRGFSGAQITQLFNDKAVWRCNIFKVDAAKCRFQQFYSFNDFINIVCV